MLYDEFINVHLNTKKSLQNWTLQCDILRQNAKQKRQSPLSNEVPHFSPLPALSRMIPPPTNFEKVNPPPP